MKQVVVDDDIDEPKIEDEDPFEASWSAQQKPV